MNVTFLIGNGFDLGVGLRTGYKDFYKVYCESESTGNSALKHFKADILKHPDTWADFESSFGQYASNFLSSDEYMQLFEDFMNGISQYIEKEERRFDETNTDEMIRGMKTGLTNYYKLRPVDRAVLDDIISRNFKTYNFITFNYTQCLDKCVDAIKSSPKRAELIQGEIDRVVHVHGYTNKDMIIGVNDGSQIANDAFAQNSTVIDEIVKPRQNEIIKMNYDYRATKLIQESTIICIYGMSLGATDQKWWELLLEWLQADENRHLIILKHEDPNKPLRLIPHWRRFVNQTKDSLFSYGEIPEESKEKLEARIHIDVDNNIFAMNIRKKLKASVENVDAILAGIK